MLPTWMKNYVMNIIGNLMVFMTVWLRYYVIFRKAVFFICGLILVHSWVEYALVALLITYLSNIMNLPKAASVVNLLDGITAVVMLIMAYLSETYLGPFLAIVCTTTAYIFGVLLFYHGAETRLVYAAVILLGLGRAGFDIQLKEFLSDQCRTEGEGESEERVESRRKIWWGSAYILGIVASVFLFTEAEWKEVSKVLMIAMAVGLVVFLLGFSFYERKKPAKSTLYNIMKVLYVAITNRRRRHPIEYQRANIYTLSVLTRWLDKALVGKSSSGGGRVCTVEQVEEVKRLLTMLPLWSMFIVYGLMLATGNTFFYEQTEYTANYIGPISPLSNQQYYNISCNDPTLHNSDNVPAIIFVIIRYSVLFSVSCLCDFLSRLRWGNSIPSRVMLIRSGVGLALSPLCCLAAWRVEEYRLHQRWHHAVCIRFSWLIPQFVLLGLMEGLVLDAMEQFYVSVMPQTLGRYGPAFTQFALGMGHFVSVLFILIFRNLFEDDLDSSRLGVYYKNITYACCGNFVIYCCVATYYAKQESSGGDEVMEQALEQMHEQGPESVGVVGDELREQMHEQGPEQGPEQMHEQGPESVG